MRNPANILAVVVILSVLGGFAIHALHEWHHRRAWMAYEEWRTAFEPMSDHVREIPPSLHEVDERPFRYPPVNEALLQRKAKT